MLDKSCYIGFLLENKYTDVPERSYKYTIYGYLSNDLTRSIAYRAYIEEQLSERPLNIKKRMFLTENGIENSYTSGKGTGS